MIGAGGVAKLKRAPHQRGLKGGPGFCQVEMVSEWGGSHGRESPMMISLKLCPLIFSMIAITPHPCVALG